MFIGHYAVALAAKRAAPRVSLGWLVLGAQLLDLVWPILLLLGVEHVRIAPGITRVTPLDFYDYPWSHSLATSLGWGLLVFLAYWAIRRDLRGAAIVGALVPSHWLLDFVAHRPDLPLVPGGHARVGLELLWRSLPITIAVEYTMLAIGVALYLRARGRARIGFWIWLGVLIAASIGALLGPPPPGEMPLALSGLLLWVVAYFAHVVDRTTRSGSRASTARTSAGVDG